MRRRILALILALTFPLHALAEATQSNPDALMPVVDEYVHEVQATPKDADPAFADAQAAFFASSVAVQVRKLEPEDFNLFMLALMSRYIHRPAERDALFKLVKSIREWIADDLANTARLEKGAFHYMNPANYSWYTWVIIGAGAVIGRGVFKGPLRTTRFVQSMEQMQLAAARWRAPYRLAFRTATHPLTVATAAGAGLGLLEYELQKNKMHRLDPLLMANAVQAQIACYLSYQGLGLEERFESIREDEAKLREGYAGLKKDIEEVTNQSKLLLEQFARLDNIYVNEPDFQKQLSKLPQAKDFQEFRKVLTTADQAQDGQCRQMSLTQLVISLEKMQENLKLFYEAMVPPEAAPAPQQGAQP